MRISDKKLSVDLADGRTIAVPLQWFPRLWHAVPAERERYELGRVGIHWPAADEDISVQSLLRGEKSGETPQSIRRWLDGRQVRR